MVPSVVSVMAVVNVDGGDAEGKPDPLREGGIYKLRFEIDGFGEPLKGAVELAQNFGRERSPPLPFRRSRSRSRSLHDEDQGRRPDADQALASEGQNQGRRLHPEDQGRRPDEPQALPQI